MRREGLEDRAGAPTRALVELVHAHRGHMSPEARAAGGARLVERVRSRRTRWARAGVLGVAAAVMVSLFVLSRPILHRGTLATPVSTPLSYVVEGAPVGVAGAIAADHDEARVRFSDGTEVALAAGTRASIRSVSAQGASLSLADGKAHVDVVHLPGARWSVDAGPFRIAVTGTAFTVEWKAADERLDVRMERGSVEIVGPLSDGPIALRSGQHLIVRARERETVIRDAEDPAGSVAPAPSSSAMVLAASAAGGANAWEGAAGTDGAGSAPPRGPARSPGRDGRMARAPSSAGSAHAWSSALAAGDFDAIVRDADRAGLDACMAESSLADLAALADAARFTQKDAIARRALLAERRRFALSRPARDAAFLLGRIEEAERNLAGALEWYDRYLAETPGGVYASDALGRKMVATIEVYGDERARSVANEYLSRFPQGAYAVRARSLTRGP